MANYSTNEFKGGLKIMLDGEPCNILENEYVKPGKGQAFNRVKIRKLISGKVLDDDKKLLKEIIKDFKTDKSSDLASSVLINSL